MSFDNSSKRPSQSESASNNEYQEEYGGLIYNQDQKEHEELIETPNISQRIKLYKPQLQDIQVSPEEIESKTNSAKSAESPNFPQRSLPETPQEENSSLTRQIRQTNTNENTYYNGSSLGSLSGEIKKDFSFKDKSKLPTFGEDELNMAVAKQISESPSSVKKQPSKIDKMLEEHKKRKALQKYLETKNSPELSPILPDQRIVSKDSNAVTSETQQSQGLSIPTSSERDQQKTTVGYSAALANYDSNKKGHYVRQQLEAMHDSVQAVRGIIDQLPEVHSSVNSTGRFGGSQIPLELAESSQDSGRYREGESGSNTKKSSDSKFRSPHSRKDNQKYNDQKATRVPRINGNSQKIFENSTRAKDDEKIIHELLTIKAKRLLSADSKDAAQLQNIPEENEETWNRQVKAKQSQGESLKMKNKVDSLPETALTKSSSYNAPSSPRTPERSTTKSSFYDQKYKESSPAMRNIKTFERSNSSNSKAMSESQKSVNGKESTKRSHFKKILKSYDMSEHGISSPQSVKSRTIIEHKKKPFFLSRKAEMIQNGTKHRTASLSPTRKDIKEIKEIATMTKNIYLKVVNKDNIDSPDKSLDTTPKSTNTDKNVKGQNKNPTSEFLRKMAAQKNNDIEKMSPEELAKYDEIQRLEIMLQNLREIQKANLLSTALFRSNSSKDDDSKPILKRSYTNTINEQALERRDIKKKKEEEKLAKTRKSPRPTKMEKIDMTLDSLIQSIQLRQNLILNYNQEELDAFRSFESREDMPARAWEDFNLYDRNVMWLLVRNKKLEMLNDVLREEELKDCSFQPNFFTYRRSSDMPNRSSVGQSPLRNNMSQDQENSEGVDNSHWKNRSIYKERTYTELFDLKKSYYNIYKSDIYSPKKGEPLESGISQQEDRSQNDFSESTIKRQITTE